MMIIQNMKRLTDKHGAVLPVVAISLFVLLGFAAFGIDLGYLYVVKNELQNAADAAALAGASVLFNDNKNCLSSGSPYYCCTGPGTGSCSPSVIDNASIISTATAVAGKNQSGGNSVPAPIVEIGHYAFASSWTAPGVFTANMTGSQMNDWQTQSFNTLNEDTDFINAVRATVTRTDVPRFFSAIFGSSPHTVSVQATAYVGFAGSLEPGVLDAPIAICKQSIITDKTCTSDCQYSCVDGRMINSSSGNATSNTGAWTNFTQEPCTTANPSNIPSACSALNPAVFFGQGMGTVGGQQTPVQKRVEACWLKNCNTSGPVTNPQNCTRPWKLLLPVIDCPSNNPGPCSKLLGAVEINLLWMWGQNPDMDKGPMEMRTFNPTTETYDLAWSCPVSCQSLANCQGANDRGNCKGNCCWNSFVQKFNLMSADNLPPLISDTRLKPSDLADTMFFLPDCAPHAPAGGTGGENYGVLAQYPVLVK